MFKIIQGDTESLSVTVTEGAELIEELWFSSSDLNIVQKLSKISDTQYLLVLEPATTCNCKVCITTYDITAILKDNQVSTAVYNGEISVYKKENAINGNQD